MSNIDVSGIDETKPVYGNPTTASVRANFAAIKTQLSTAKTELEDLSASGALTYFIGTRNTTAPNDTVPVHALEATGAETNIDVVLAPKGSGAILVKVPDGTATGGNKRGSRAVDLQSLRSIATRVASGIYSAIGGGTDNTASGLSSTVAGGGLNTASNLSATIGGGNSNTASGTYSTIAGGDNNEANGDFSTIPGGRKASARSLFGKYAYSSGSFSITGDAQIGRHILRRQTSDATAAILTANGAAPSVLNVPVLPDNHAYAITAHIIARNTSTGDTKVWTIEGAAKRGAGASTVALIGTPTKTVIATDTGASAWDVNLVVNTTRGSAEVEVIGAAATTIRWVCKFDTVEVG